MPKAIRRLFINYALSSAAQSTSVTSHRRSEHVCAPQTWTQTTTYLQLVGILLGQLTFGVMGDWVGRKTAMLTDMVRGSSSVTGRTPLVRLLRMRRQQHKVGIEVLSTRYRSVVNPVCSYPENGSWPWNCCAAAQSKEHQSS